MSRFLKQASLFSSCEEQTIQHPSNKPEPKEHLGLYGECYDSLPTINTSSSFMFNVNSFALHDIVEDLVDGEVLTSPVGNSSFLSKSWLAIQLRLDGVERDRRYDILSKTKRAKRNCEELTKYSAHDIFVMESLAPYGYEYEDSFAKVQSKEAYLPYKAHDKLANYSPKFVSGKIILNRLVETEVNIYFTEFMLRCTYNTHENLLLTTLVKKTTRKFLFWKESKQLVVLTGSKLKMSFVNYPLPSCMTDLMETFLEKKDPLKLKVLKQSNARDFAVWRKVLLNRFWTDINSKYAVDYLRSTDNLYSRVMYHYKKYGTKQARHALYGTKHKGLIRAYEFFSNNHQTHEAIQTTKYLVEQKGYTEDKALSLLNHTVSLFANAQIYSGSPMYMYSLIFFKQLEAVQAVYPEITFAKLKNLPPQHVGVEIRDIANTISQIQRAAASTNPPVEVSYPMFTMDLGVLSTRLSNLFQSFRNIEEQVPFVKSEEMKERFDFKDEHFTYRYADSIFKLKECGNALNICVGSYGWRAKDHSTNIVFVHKNDSLDKHYACIEVTHGSVRQVKLHRNTRGHTDDLLNESVIEWATTRDLDVDGCYDLNVPERLDAVRGSSRNNNDYHVDLLDLF